MSNRMSEEKVNLNYNGFIQKLKKYNYYTESFENDTLFNEQLKTAVASINENSGLNYDGSLIEHTKRIAVIAYNLNENIHEEVKVDIDSLVKVTYLCQISKAIIFSKSATSVGGYKFNDKANAMKVGEYSLYLCSKYGINLSADEYEAISSVDKSEDDQKKYYGNALSQILKSAIEIADTEARIRYKIHKV